jgi:RNA polymerase sigma factor (sigma-70 family)
MAQGPLSEVLTFIRRVAGAGGDQALPDADLLARFIAARDEAAFTEILARHGPLVLGVCRSILGDSSDAADAFQATFLILVHRARSISKQASLGSWLYGVAYRVSVRARAVATRPARMARAVRGQPLRREDMEMAAHEPRSDAADAEIRAIVHEEVNCLPEKYRAPIVLCYMEGRSRLEAASTLCLSEGTIKGRLERARDLLHKRLAGRGVSFSVALLAAAAGADAASAAGGVAAAAVPAALAHATLRAALVAAAGKTAAAGTISGPVAVLTQQVLETMVVTPRQITSVVMLIMVLCIGAGMIAQQVFGESETAPPAAAPADPVMVRNHQGQALDLLVPAAVAVPLGLQAEAFPPPGMPIASAAYGNWVALALPDQTVRVTAVSDRTILANLAGHTAAITALAVSPDGRWLATGSADHTVQVWDVAHWRPTGTLRGHAAAVTALAFSPDGRLVITGSADKTGRVWDRETCRELCGLAENDEIITSIAFPSGDRDANTGRWSAGWIATGGDGLGMSLWDPNTGRQLGQVRGHVGLVTAVAMTRDRTLAATASRDATVKLWRLPGMEEGVMLQGHPGPVGALAFDAQGKRLATVDATAVRLWDPATGRQLARYDSDCGAILSVAFHPDGRTILTGSADRAVKRWPVF